MFGLIYQLFGVTQSEILSPSKNRNITAARKQICLIMWRKGYTQDEIAKRINRTPRGVSYLISKSN